MVSPDRTRDGHPAIAFVVPFSFEGRKRSRHARPWRARERGYEHDGDRTERRLLAEDQGGPALQGAFKLADSVLRVGRACAASATSWCKSSCSFQVAVAALYFYIIRAIKLLTVELFQARCPPALVEGGRCAASAHHPGALLAYHSLGMEQN
jgi:hypothetical protein